MPTRSSGGRKKSSLQTSASRTALTEAMDDIVRENSKYMSTPPPGKEATPSRALGNDNITVELAAPVEVLSPDEAGEMLAMRNQQRRDPKASASARRLQRCRHALAWLVLVQALVVPIVFFVMAVRLQDEVWAVPALVSLCLAAFVVYFERGPGGALEKAFDNCAPIGCLQITARQDDECPGRDQLA